MSSRSTRLLLMLSAFVAGLILCFSVVLLVTDRAGAPIIAAPAIGGPFKLTDQNGKTITDQDLKGHPFLVFFGFTHCPDVCPTALADISDIFDKLGGDADKVNALFITVDPERDTPQALKDYLSSFNARLIGVGGDADALAAVAKAYRVYYKKVPLKDGDYTMDHTAIVYLMDKNGQFVAPFSLKRRPEEAAADLRRYF
ncbi:MAG TPA: SCO family protein [Xanthobacteraceae bacterium]|nr:SCO family protein [Xanthobacteraceae bacterium]